VSKAAAFQYATALNHLLRFDSRQKITIANTTTVFWTEQPTLAENLFSYLIDPNQLGHKESEDDAQKQKLRTILTQIAQGIKPSELGNPATRFYILGLSANASRLSVRYWHVATLGEVTQHLAEHFAALRIVRGHNGSQEFPAVYQLLLETVRRGKSVSQDLDNVSPLLEGALMRSILLGTPYPQSLPLAVINRVRADQTINPNRAAILKAVLIRNHNQDIPMALKF